jgi:type IV pilus assembly protein PilO
MNPKVEKVLKLPLYQRLIILAVLVVVVIGCFVWFLWLPEFEKIGQKEKELSKLQAEYIQKKQIADNLPKFKAEFAKLEELLKEALTQLPNKKEIPSLLTNLATLARDSGLEVISFTPKREALKDFYAEVPAALSLKGNYHQFAEFAQAVGDLSRIVNISDIDFGTPKVDENMAILTIKSKVTTFRFVEK